MTYKIKHVNLFFFHSLSSSRKLLNNGKFDLLMFGANRYFYLPDLFFPGIFTSIYFPY